MKTIIILFGIAFSLSCSNYKRLEHRADNGNIEACYSIVDHYSGTHYSSSDKKAQEKVVKYAKTGLSIKLDTNYFVDEYYSLFYRELAKSFLSSKPEKYSYYKNAAFYGDGEAQWATSLIYFEGKDGKINNDSAMYWLNKAAIGNNYIYEAAAENELGDIYTEGKIIKVDSILALYHYKRACACFRQYSNLQACEKVIKFYESKVNLRDTTELSIYKELGRRLRK